MSAPDARPPRRPPSLVSRLAWRLLEWPVALGFLLYWWLVRLTSRVVESPGIDGPAIYVNWHRHQSLIVPHHGRYRRWMMVSPAPPLVPVARFCRFVGVWVAIGATGDGGRQALARLRAALAEGQSVALAVDGPAGPPFHAKRGCADLALATGVPIVPTGYRCRRGSEWRWRWDRTLFVPPFNVVEILEGPPIAPTGTPESLLARVEQGLNELMAREARSDDEPASLGAPASSR